MKTIPHMHDFTSGLPDPVRAEVESRCRQRRVRAGESVYIQGDLATEMYQLITGSVKLCNYSFDGREFLGLEFRAGDCFGEMGLIDGLARVSHAVATTDCLLKVLAKQDFEHFLLVYPEFAQQVMLMLCHRARYAYGMLAEAGGLNLRQRLALQLFRLGHSHGCRDGTGDLYISMSQEELGRMVGASRQTINKCLQELVKEGCIELRYGKIYLVDIEGMQERYEHLMGLEQIAASYETGA